VASPLAADRALVDRHHARAGGDRSMDEGALARAGDPVTTTSTPSGMSTSTSRRLWRVAPRISSVPAGPRTVSFSAAWSSSGRAVEAEVGEPDLDERVEDFPQRRHQQRYRRFIQAPQPFGEVADLHRAGVGDVDPLDLGRARGVAEPGAVAVWTGREGDCPVH